MVLKSQVFLKMASNDDSQTSSISSSSDEANSSGHEADLEDSEGEQFERDMREIVNVMRTFNPYMYEPEMEVSSVSSSDEQSLSTEASGESEYFDAKDDTRVGHLDWCKCGHCKIETREIDCLCCKEVDALNSKFDNEQMPCITHSEEFKTLCTNKTVLKNVLVAFHETRADPYEEVPENRSFRYAAYKQFIWWVYDHLGRGNRRVIPSCALWFIRSLYPDEKYTKYSAGKKD